MDRPRTGQVLWQRGGTGGSLTGQAAPGPTGPMHLFLLVKDLRKPVSGG